MRASWSGRSRATQAILAATCEPSRLHPERAYHSPGAIRSSAARHSGSARRSIQMIAGPAGCPFRSTHTSPSSCEPNDTARTRRRLTLADRSRKPLTTAARQSRGSCSAHPGRGYDSVCGW